MMNRRVLGKVETGPIGQRLPDTRLTATAAVMILLLLSSSLTAQTPAVASLLNDYRAEIEATAVEQTELAASDSGATVFTAERGRINWYRVENERSCTSCHGEDLSVVGRHQKTGKVIEPLAPSANPERLTDVKHIKKWLLRNCKWTYGRECSAQEKGDFLVWLSTL